MVYGHLVDVYFACSTAVADHNALGITVFSISGSALDAPLGGNSTNQDSFCAKVPQNLIEVGAVVGAEPRLY